MSRRDAQVITAIWFGVFFALAEIGGENPTANEEFYGLALFFIAASVMTGVYLLVRETRTKKKTGHLSLSTSGSEQTTTPSEDDRSPAWRGVVDVVVVVVLWFVGATVAFNLGVPDTASSFVGLLLPLTFILVRQVRRSRTRKS